MSVRARCSVHHGPQGAFQRLERGELELPTFYQQFEQELTDPANYALYEQYLELRGHGTHGKQGRVRGSRTRA